MIALLGSVFSPYYAWSRQRGQADPLDHCALNIALYGNGMRRWAMTERGRSDLHQGNTDLGIGPSTLEWDGNRLTIEIEEFSAPLPRRLSGRVRVYPTALNEHDFALDATNSHSWWPIAPIARVEAEFTHPALTWQGHGYWDSNRGIEPLEQAFQRWDWSRAELQQGAAILYDVTARIGAGTTLALRCNSHGQLEEFEPPPRISLPTTNIWRIGRGTQCDSGHEAKVLTTLEDTPFYARSVVETRLLGEQATSVHESLCLDRFRSDWVKLLLPFRMPRIIRHAS